MRLIELSSPANKYKDIHINYMHVRFEENYLHILNCTQDIILNDNRKPT
jgi:hypothetical protein